MKMANFKHRSDLLHSKSVLQFKNENGQHPIRRRKLSHYRRLQILRLQTVLGAYCFGRGREGVSRVSKNSLGDSENRSVPNANTNLNLLSVEVNCNSLRIPLTGPLLLNNLTVGHASNNKKERKAPIFYF